MIKGRAEATIATPVVIAVLASAACTLPTSGLAGGVTSGAPGSTGSASSSGEGASSASVTGSGGATGSTSSSTGGGGNGGAPESNCLDGIDDEGDGLTDCADPDCNAFVCVPLHPRASAWIARAGGGCAPPMTARTLLECAACTCDASDSMCTVDVSVYDGADCSSFLATFTGTGICIDNEPDADRSFIADVEPPGVACTSPTAVPAQPIASCSTTTAGSCADGAACLPAPTNGPWCVLVEGEVACTAPYERAGTVYDDDGSDTCSCSCTAEVRCDAAVVLASSNSDACMNPQSLPVDGDCHTIGNTDSYRIPEVAAQVSCTPATLPQNGGAAMTLCCLR